MLSPSANNGPPNGPGTSRLIGGLGVGASSNSSGEVVVRTQRTLTVIIKFIDGIVSSFQTRSTSF